VEWQVRPHGGQVEYRGVSNDIRPVPNVFALRGAAWDSRSPLFILASARDYITPDYRGGFIGFRCVLAIETPPEASTMQPSPEVVPTQPDATPPSQ